VFERAPIRLTRRGTDLIEAWRLDDNQRRPHGSLGHLTQNEFVAQRQAEPTDEEVRCSR